jgi:hypothetical protein
MQVRLDLMDLEFLQPSVVDAVADAGLGDDVAGLAGVVGMGVGRMKDTSFVVAWDGTEVESDLRNERDWHGTCF